MRLAIAILAAVTCSGCVATCYRNTRPDGGKAWLARVAILDFTVLQRGAGLSLHADGSARLDGYSKRADSEGIKATGAAVGAAGKALIK